MKANAAESDRGISVIWAKVLDPYPRQRLISVKMDKMGGNVEKMRKWEWINIPFQI